ncbi:MAG: hypothetical protein E6G59_00060 [Actinobacteria bacterium]|nr:MAG: hypothetical protein E6G59_00060 [Actinomycetota bacterium]
MTHYRPGYVLDGAWVQAAIQAERRGSVHHRFEAITVADPGLKEICLKEESGASRDSWWLKILAVDELSESEEDPSRPPLPTLRGTTLVALTLNVQGDGRCTVVSRVRRAHSPDQGI